MTSPRDLFSDEDIEAIEAAVAAAERDTSGEICVHIDHGCKGDPVKKAKQIFAARNLHKTKFRNAVLFYIAIGDSKLAIWGDEGINAKVPDDFWQQEADLMLEKFKQAKYTQGLVEAIKLAGQRLQEYFPYEQKGSLNEIEDDVSFGK